MSPGGGFHYQACISPDGLAVLYAGNASGPPQIWSSNLDGSERVALSSPDSGARHGVYSWDGRLIAYTSDQASGHPPQLVEDIGPENLPTHGNIYVMDKDGGGVTQLTKGRFTDQRPCFSPDGSTIVFVSDRSGGFTLWSVPVDGSASPEPLPFRSQAYRPWFSVDGEWLYFIGLGRGHDYEDRHQIHKVRTVETEAEPFVNDDKGRSHGPFADPGGEVLLMHSTRDGDWRLWKLPLDGSAPRKLQPPGIEQATHATRARNGVISFDVVHH